MQTFLPGLFETAADRVRGVALCKRGIFQKPVGRPVSYSILSIVHRRADLRDRKIALCEGSGLVKYHSPDIGQGLHEVGSFDQDALAAGAADSAEKCKRDTDNNRAGAADDQECQRSVDPVGPQIPTTGHMQENHVDQGTENCQCKGTVADRRCVPAGKFRNKLLGFGLACAGVLDQVQNTGRGGFLELFGRLHAQKAGQVDGSAEDFLSRRDIPGQGFACQSRGVNGRSSLHDHTVDGHPLSGFNKNNAADLDVVGVSLLHAVLCLQIGVVRPDIHQLADIFSALSDRIALEELSDLVKEHDRDSLGILAECHGAHGCCCHEEVLVKYLPVPDPLNRLAEDIMSNRKIRDEKQHKAQDRILFQRQE